jgi:hypothetical protein
VTLVVSFRKRPALLHENTQFCHMLLQKGRRSPTAWGLDGLRTQHAVAVTCHTIEGCAAAEDNQGRSLLWTAVALCGYSWPLQLAMAWAYIIL